MLGLVQSIHAEWFVLGLRFVDEVLCVPNRVLNPGVVLRDVRGANSRWTFSGSLLFVRFPADQNGLHCFVCLFGVLCVRLPTAFAELFGYMAHCFDAIREYCCARNDLFIPKTQSVHEKRKNTAHLVVNGNATLVILRGGLWPKLVCLRNTQRFPRALSWAKMYV